MRVGIISLCLIAQTAFACLDNIEKSSSQVPSHVEVFPIFVAPFGSEDYQNCGTNNTNACSLKAAATRSSDAAAQLIMAPGAYSIVDRIFFSDAHSLSIVASDYLSARLEAKSPDAQIVFTNVESLFVANISFVNFQSSAVQVLSLRIDAVFEGCLWKGNTAIKGNGAAVFFVGDNIKFRHCQFEQNVINATESAEYLRGGALYLRIAAARPIPTVLFDNCSFLENSIQTSMPLRSAAGGSLRVQADKSFDCSSVQYVNITIRNSNFRSGSISVNGTSWPQSYTGPTVSGGELSISFEDNAAVFVNIESSQFSNARIDIFGIRSLSTAGGSISLSLPHPSSSLVITDSTMTNNSASTGVQRLESSSVGVCQGGALQVFTSGRFKLSTSQYTYNKCYGTDGGLFGTLVSGGAIDFTSVSSTSSNVSIVIESSIFVNNSLETHAATFGNAELAVGGAVALQLRHLNRMDSLVINNCSFSANTLKVVTGEAYGGALSIGNIGTEKVPISVSGAFKISNSTFLDNSVREKARTDSWDGLDRFPAYLNGGGISVRLALASDTILSVQNLTMLRNLIIPDKIREKYSIIAWGAAAFFDISRKDPYSSSALLVSASHFEDNNATGSYVRGAAIAFKGYHKVEFRSSLVRKNNVYCAGSAKATECHGGGIYVSKASALIENVDLIENSISTHRHCGTVLGGALYFLNSFSTIKNTNLDFNFVSGSLAEGGAVFVEGSHCQFSNTTWRNNYVEGSLAFGGAIATSASHLQFNDSSFDSSRATSSNDYEGDCGLVLSRFEGTEQSAGGTMSFQAINHFVMQNVAISNSQAHNGGSIWMGNSFLQKFEKMEIRNTTIQESTASGAGGGLFFSSMCEIGFAKWEWMTRICYNITFATSVNASNYGDTCASPALTFSADGPPRFDAWPVAPGDKKSISFVVKDIFGSRMKLPSIRVNAKLQRLIDAGVKMHSGAPQDSVFSDESGELTFEDFYLTGNVSSMGTVAFSTNAPRLCTHYPLRDVMLLFQITPCMPSYTMVDGLCQRCPIGSYTLTENATTCVPCLEEASGAGNEEIIESNSCLSLAHPLPEQHHRHKSEPVFEISEGFYPAPSLEAPTRLEKCPNHACLPFHCMATTVKNNLSWYLNCSQCPTLKNDSHSSSHDGSGPQYNQTDCHCLAGYEDRLCSRCSCPPTGRCFFFSGEREDHHCLPCRNRTTAVVVVAVVILLLSLVIFLLFQRSALALLLSEAAIAITLLLLGIGESWMLDLLLIMGLLFLATSFSKRIEKNRRNRSVHFASDTETEEDESHSHHRHHHQHHELDSQTASMAKITVFFVQSVASIVRDAAWPSWIETAMKQLEAFNLRVSGIECFAPALLGEPIGKLFFHLSLPWLLGIVLSLAALAAAIIVKIDPVYRFKLLFQRCKQPSKTLPRPSLGEAPSDSENDRLLVQEENYTTDSNSEDVPPQPAKFSIGDLKSRVVFSSLFMLSASYFELSNAVLEIMRPCNHGYMAAIPWIPCSFADARYPALLITAIIFFIVYSIGIPGFFGFILLHHRRRISAGDPVLEAKYGFLYETYRPGVFWFELIWFLRRILLSIAVSVLTPRPGYQMAAVMSILLGSLLLHRYVQPFTSPLANLMDLVATIILIFATTMGFVTEVFEIDGSPHGHVLQNLIWTTCALCTLSLLVILVFPLLRSVHDYLRGRKSKRGNEYES